MMQLPLSEAALAAVLETLRVLNAAGNRIDALAGELQGCRVPFDVTPFRNVRDALDAPYKEIADVLTAHYAVVSARRAYR